MRLLGTMLLALMLMGATVSFAASVNTVKITATGGAPIPTSYTTGSQSLVLQGLDSRAHLIVVNDTTSRIAVHVDQVGPNPPSNDVRDIYIPASSAQAMDNLAVGQKVYLRSDSGSTITSGQVMFVAW